MKEYIVKISIEEIDSESKEIKVLKSRKLDTFQDQETSEAFYNKFRSPDLTGVTIQQAKYWYSVAKKDLTVGNLDGADGVYCWLVSNNAWFHARLLKKAIKEYV